MYLTDGTFWTDIQNLSNTNVLLLASNAKIRYLPNGTGGGQARLTIHAWDQTQGVSGGTLDSTGKLGGDNSLSTASRSLLITVT
jgi:hypothetical protein